MASNSSETIFIKIKDSAEKKHILDGILKERREVVIKSKATGGDVLPIIPVSFVRNQLNCRLPNSLSNDKSFAQSIVQFSVGTEKYLALCDCSISGDSITLNMDTEIFKLQRREDFRLKLPSSYRAQFHLQKLNQLEPKILIPIIDISGGGCRLLIDKNKLPLDIEAVVVGEIQLANRKEISITGSIKHIADDPSDEDQLIVGLQFENVSGPSKDRLVGIVMDIYKELFSRI